MRRSVAAALIVLACLAPLAACGVPAPAPAGDLAITLAAEPATPLAGAPASLVFGVSSDGQPLAGARVLVVRRMIGVVHPDDDIVFESVEQGPGRYVAATSFATAGRWDVQVVVTPSAGEARTAAFTVEVAGP